MDPLLVIENRIGELECKMGFSPEEQYETSAVDQLSQAETVLNSVTSGREKITEINKRLDELNGYLDPQYVNMVGDGKLKLNYIMTNEKNIQHHCEAMQLCQDKSPVLASEPLANITALSRSLDKLKAVNVENKEHCDQVESSVLQAMETYNRVSLTVMENLAAISKKIDNLEKAKAQAK